MGIFFFKYLPNCRGEHELIWARLYIYYYNTVSNKWHNLGEDISYNFALCYFVLNTLHCKRKFLKYDFHWRKKFNWMKVSGWKIKLLSNRYDNRTNFGLFHISQDERDLYFEGLRWRSTMRKNGVQRAYWTVTPQWRLKRA